MKWALLLALLPLNASAFQIQASYGVNPPWKGVHVKTAQLSLSHPLSGSFIHKLSYGHWFEGSRSGGLPAYSIGAEITSLPLSAALTWGIGYLPKPDDYYLSGHLQFVNDVSVGVRASDCVTIGLAYRHISNAGIVMPNRGRDFLMFNLGWGLKCD